MEKPNIILINCDDLGYGDLGCYGSPVNKTPVLDKMADDGIRFTDFYMASPVCSPSRGAMMTGCYPSRIGFGKFCGNGYVLFPGDPEGLNPEETTVAGLLKEQGYSTMLVGKWHCGDQKEFLPTRHGFDHYYGLPYSNDMARQKGVSPHPPLPLLKDEEVIQQQPDQAALTERYTEKCVEFIRDNKENPFFLYFAHMYVHVPIYTPKNFMEQSDNGRYGAGVECVDWSTSVILHELEKQGLTENTLVIFTSDNGSRAQGEGGSNLPLRGTKASTWDGGQRVPCIMRWPAKIAAGQVNSELVSSIDFLPTFTGMAGGEVPEDIMIDGKDISALMYGEEDAKSPHKYFYYYRGNSLCAVRNERWKLHVLRVDWGSKEEVLELYDLQNDVGETANLVDQYPEVEKELQKALDVMRNDIGDDHKGIKGANCRPIGKVEKGVPLTTYDESHPYIQAEYDLPDRG